MYRRVNQASDRRKNVGEHIFTSGPRAGPRQVSDRFTNVALNGFIVITPMLAFSAVLLGLVHRYRVTSGVPASDTLRASDIVDEAGVYYVDFSATVLIFIASWSSSLGPLLGGFVMTLASYPIARKYWNDIRDQSPLLPTPFQFAATLKFLSGGGWGALYSWVKYLGGWKKQRQLQSKLLTHSASFAILAALMGLLVFLADTWLHVTTKTVNFVQVNQVTDQPQYSLVLSPDCLRDMANGADTSGCSINPAATQIFLMGPTTALQTLNNISDTMAVFNNGPDSTYAYLGIPASHLVSRRDYTATTFGMRTQCKTVSEACNLNAYAGAFTPFRCSDAFEGDLQSVSAGWLYTYFTNDSMASNQTYTEGVKNPYYYGLATLFKNPGGSGLTQYSMAPVPGIVTPVHGGVAFVLLCSITMYDVEYDSVNGTISRFVATPSNASVANIWQAPMAHVDVAQPNLQTAASVAASSAKNAQDLADQIALAYSKVALGVGAQSVRRAPTIAAQERTALLVARVPKAPLFALVGANLLFVLLGCILTGVALGTSGGETRDIQARLSIVGLVADRFEGGRAAGQAGDLDELFEEHEGNTSSRVVMARTTAGGYGYRTLSRVA